MTVRRNDLISQLRNRIMPQIDDPRQRFLREVRKGLAGSSGIQPTTTTATPRRRSGVRTGRPVRPRDG